jgi:hypothetical protein
MMRQKQKFHDFVSWARVAWTVAFSFWLTSLAIPTPMLCQQDLCHQHMLRQN